MPYGFSKQELLELSWEKPILAQLKLTDKCNQNCIFCYSGYKSSPSTPDLPLESWQRILCKLENLGISRLDFTGRESFMYPRFAKLANWSKKRGFEIKINTNGTHDVSCVLESADEIIFSVHGLCTIHDEIVGYRGSFALLETNYGRVIAAGLQASINMSLVKTNYHQLLDVFTYFNSRYGVHKFAPSIPVPSLGGKIFKESALTMSRELIEDYLSRLKQIPTEKLTLKHGFHSVFINNREWYKDSGLLLPNCAAGKYKLMVENDGRVFPCSFFKGNEYYCGNILTDDEKQIWKNGYGFERFRRLILEERIPEQCQMCLKKPRCFSGCRAWTTEYQEGGFDYAKDRRCDMGSAFIRG